MSPMTDDDLRRGLLLHREPLERLDEDESQWNIGQVTLKKNEATFRVSYWEPVVAGSWFYARPFDFGTDHRGAAAIFRTADPADADCREYVVGWVRASREADLSRWIEGLNAQIARLVAETPPRGSGSPIDIGMYREFGYEADEPGVRSLRDVRRTRRAEHKAQVVAYLRNAQTTAYTMGIEPDVFDSTKLAGQLSGKTDGTYRWPELLAYYVEHYDIALPDDFEEHMRKSGWKVPRAP